MKIRLWFMRETEKARLYSTVPAERGQTEDTQVWIPRSVVEHTTKRGVEHVLELPDWFVDKEEL